MAPPTPLLISCPSLGAKLQSKGDPLVGRYRDISGRSRESQGGKATLRCSSRTVQWELWIGTTAESNLDPSSTAQVSARSVTQAA